MKHTPFLHEMSPSDLADAVYCLYGHSEGEEKLSVRAVKRTRRPHQCMCPDCGPHPILPGSPAVVEAARVDGEFGSCYTCEACAVKGSLWSGGDEVTCKTVARRLKARAAK